MKHEVSEKFEHAWLGVHIYLLREYKLALLPNLPKCNWPKREALAILSILSLCVITLHMDIFILVD